METNSKTTVDIIQELITIHTTRKEVTDKLLPIPTVENNKEVLLAAKQQSDRFITALLPELSNFGDAVKDSTARDNEYELMWKNALGNISSLDATDAISLFNKLENALKNIYQQLLETKDELPPSLYQIISKQLQQLR